MRRSNNNDDDDNNRQDDDTSYIPRVKPSAVNAGNAGEQKAEPEKSESGNDKSGRASSGKDKPNANDSSSVPREGADNSGYIPRKAPGKDKTSPKGGEDSSKPENKEDSGDDYFHRNKPGDKDSGEHYMPASGKNNPEGKANHDAKKGDEMNKKSPAEKMAHKAVKGAHDLRHPVKGLKNGAKNKIKHEAGLGKKKPEDTPIGRFAKNFGKKALKTAGKAAPIAGGAYLAGQLFDNLKRKFGLLLGNLGQDFSNALSNSALGHALNLAHNVAQGIGNAAAQAGNALGHIGAGIGHMATAAVHGIAHGASVAAHAISTGIAHVASAIGTTATHAAAGMGLTAVVAAATVAGSVIYLQSNGVKDDYDDNNCVTNVEEAQSGGGSLGDAKGSGQEMKNAHIIFDVFKRMGLNDDQIAGILGNWSQESGIDPTSVEGIYTEKYSVNGPLKTRALGHDAKKEDKAALAAWTRHVSTGSSEYNNGGTACGVGLGQWTGGAKVYPMWAAANKLGMHWYDIKFQLAYILASKTTPTGMPSKRFWSGMKAQKSTAAASAYMLAKWEGCPGVQLSQRTSFATRWRSKISSWQADDKVGDSILKLAHQTGAKATSEAVDAQAENCAQANAEGVGDNSSVVKAALAYAWDNEHLASGNKGTELYQRVHRAILPGDPFFESCDRNVCCAERWSGTDVHYPAGPTNYQLSYLKASKKWKEVGVTNHFNYKDLKPGDVMCKNGHTYLYVGNAAVRASIKAGEHKASDVPHNADDVDASYGERSAGIGIEARFSIIQHGDGPYYIFRCIHPDHSTKYKSVASHMGKNKTSK